ncbi:MAG TPA: hypothetical protein VMR81_01475 [Patescibacteria group bacterium]|nr:hypothetical protein [Patescibacteria group bacterium]
MNEAGLAITTDNLKSQHRLYLVGPQTSTETDWSIQSKGTLPIQFASVVGNRMYLSQPQGGLADFLLPQNLAAELTGKDSGVLAGQIFNLEGNDWVTGPVPLSNTREKQIWRAQRANSDETSIIRVATERGSVNHEMNEKIEREARSILSNQGMPGVPEFIKFGRLADGRNILMLKDDWEEPSEIVNVDDLSAENYMRLLALRFFSFTHVLANGFIYKDWQFNDKVRFVDTGSTRQIDGLTFMDFEAIPIFDEQQFTQLTELYRASVVASMTNQEISQADAVERDLIDYLKQNGTFQDYRRNNGERVLEEIREARKLPIIRYLTCMPGETPNDNTLRTSTGQLKSLLELMSKHNSNLLRAVNFDTRERDVKDAIAILLTNHIGDYTGPEVPLVQELSLILNRVRENSVQSSVSRIQNVINRSVPSAIETNDSWITFKK